MQWRRPCTPSTKRSSMRDSSCRSMPPGSRRPTYSDSSLSAAERRKRAEMYVEVLNHGLQGIPPEKVRFHTCYGINEGPRVHDAPLKDVVDVMLKVNVGAYSFEAANARHKHEYHVWENVKLPRARCSSQGWSLTRATSSNTPNLSLSVSPDTPSWWVGRT